MKPRCATCRTAATYADTGNCRRCTLRAAGWTPYRRRVPFGTVEAWTKGDNDRLFEAAWALHLRAAGLTPPLNP